MDRTWLMTENDEENNIAINDMIRQLKNQKNQIICLMEDISYQRKVLREVKGVHNVTFHDHFLHHTIYLEILYSFMTKKCIWRN